MTRASSRGGAPTTSPSETVSVRGFRRSRRGLGRALLQAALDAAAGAGISRVELEVFASNDVAVAS